jgi:type VI protein secretion system component VasF
MSNALAEMSSSLKNVVESSATTIADLVDEARSRIEVLPPLARQRRRRPARRMAPFAVFALVALVVFMVVRQRSRRADVDPVDQSSVRHR